MRSARRTSTVLLALGVAGLAILGLGAAWFRPMSTSLHMRKNVVVDAWRVGGGPLERLRSQDVVRVGDVVEISVTSTVPTRVGAWTRDPAGQIRPWFGVEGAVVAAGENVVLDRTGPFDARPGVTRIAVHICPEDHALGADPWAKVEPPQGCRPYLWKLTQR